MKVTPIFVVFLGIALTSALLPSFIVAQTAPTFTITPASVSIPIGGTAQFTAMYNGQNVTQSATWTLFVFSSDDFNKADQISPGTFKGKAPGTVSVLAKYNGLERFVSLTIQGTEPQPRLAVFPQGPNVAVGDTLRFPRATTRTAARTSPAVRACRTWRQAPRGALPTPECCRKPGKEHSKEWQQARLS